MNNGENNNVVPNTTNNINTAVNPTPQAVPSAPVITNTVPVQAIGSVPNVASTQNTVSAPTQPSTVTTPSNALENGVLPNSQPVLNPSTDVIPVSKKAEAEEKKEKKKNKNSSSSSPLTVLFFLIAVGLGFYVFYSSNLYKTNLDNLKHNCTPVNSSKEDKQLALDSTIVVELYNKVRTSIREDYAQPDFDDTMKLYLAFRQIPSDKFYSSNCNMFKDTLMEPYKCDPKKFVPQAFKEEDLIHELKVLFGEETNIPLGNVKLRNNCIGGYAYIKERGEFVEGKCDANNAVSFSVDKKLTDAYTNRNTIVLVEEVKYKESEKMPLPDYLKSGTYYYTFRLDMNFNYVLIDKTYDSKY